MGVYIFSFFVLFVFFVCIVLGRSGHFRILGWSIPTAMLVANVLLGGYAGVVCDGVDVFWLESFFGACANFFLCEYLRAPLCDHVCGLVV